MNIPSLNHAESAALFARNRRVIPGGGVSLNRKVDPEIAFVRGQGARLWDANGNESLDYHAGFAPYLLGHADPDVDRAVIQALADGYPLGAIGGRADLMDLFNAPDPAKRVLIAGLGAQMEVGLTFHGPCPDFVA